jgi:hypothetical protein
MATDVYEGLVRPQGRFAAVFERDDDTAYFYLSDLDQAGGHRIVGAVAASEIVAMAPDVAVRIAWSSDGSITGLFVEGDLIAVFEPDQEQGTGKWVGRSASPDDRQRFADA